MFEGLMGGLWVSWVVSGSFGVNLPRSEYEIGLHTFFIKPTNSLAKFGSKPFAHQFCASFSMACPSKLLISHGKPARQTSIAFACSAEGPPKCKGPKRTEKSASVLSFRLRNV